MAARDNNDNTSDDNVFEETVEDAEGITLDDVIAQHTIPHQDWPVMMDGKARVVFMPKQKVRNYRANARRAAKARGKSARVIMMDDTEKKDPTGEPWVKVFVISTPRTH